MISNSLNLVNSFDNNFSNNNEDILVNKIEEKMRFSSKMSKISCLMNLELCNNILDSLFSIKITNNIFKNSKTKKWFQFDIDYAPNSIKIIGISNYDSLLSLHEPIFYSFKEGIS